MVTTEEKKEENETTITEMLPSSKEDFEFLDKKDEEQILAEMRGEILSDYVYIICRKHKGADGIKCNCPIRSKMVSLSYAGVKRLVHLRGNIHTELVQFIERETEFQAIFRAVDLKRNISVYGGAQQAKKTEKWYSNAGTSLETDKFAIAKVITKGQRNAWRNLIPETQALAIIKEKLQQEGIRIVSEQELEGKRKENTVSGTKREEDHYGKTQESMPL